MHRRVPAVLAALLCCRVSAAADPLIPGLTEPEFRQLGEQGFGDRGNSYAWGMAYFKGKMYIGTNRHFLCLVDDNIGAAGSGENLEIPKDCPDSIFDLDLRARIYAYDPATNRIELVFVSPTFSTLTSDGTRVDVPRAVGYRTMTVFRERDGSESLYVGTFTSTSLPSLGARILRTTDGRHFEELDVQIPGVERYNSFRSLTVYKNRLYMLGLSSDTDAPALMESSDPAGGAFRGVSPHDLGDPANSGAFELEVFAGYLYVGTFGPLDGFQLLKTQATGVPPYRFEKVLVEGAYRGIKNQSVLSLYPYKNHLYLGTGVYFGSVNLIPDFTPAAAELLRVKADDTWEIVCGDERDTPDGFKAPITTLGPGFNNPFTGYMWRMTEHEGVLYVGTLDNAVFAQYGQGIQIDEQTLRNTLENTPLAHLIPILVQLNPDEVADVISAVQGGFDLWRTVNGEKWLPVTWTGFGDSFSYGVRNLISTPLGLFVGTANPFLGMRVFLGQPAGTDADGDRIEDPSDNCPLTWNLNQADLDGDGIGDACDDDQDGDCIPDRLDRTARFADGDSTDSDGDDLSDACDGDVDGDGVLNLQDNCPTTPNADQVDSDEDDVGDACEPGSTSPVTGRPVTAPVNAQSGTGDDPTVEPTLQVTPRPCGAMGVLVGWAVFAAALGVVFPLRRAGTKATK